MRTLIIGLLIFLCWLFFCRWYYVCKIRNECKYQVEQVEEDIRAQTLNLVDNGKNVIEGYQQLKFDSKSATPILNDNNREFIQKVADYLKQNPGKTMTLTGNYLPSEVDSTARYGFIEILGVARADAVRELLVKAGIDKSRIRLDHNLLAEGASLDYPVSFNCFGDSALADNNNEVDDDAENPDEYDQGGQEFSFMNMSFSDANFAYNSAKFKPGPAFIAYADSVKIYLEEETDKSLLLTGHTCDKGSDSYNLKLGKERARSVRKYFQKLGVETNIATASDGEKNPAYPNDSEPSRSKNRRVVVQIK